MSSKQTTSPRSPSRVLCCFGTTLSFLIIVPTVCITLALRQIAGGKLVYPRIPDFSAPNRTILLRADLNSVDLAQSIMVVDWGIHGDTCYVDCSPVNIFFDTNLSPSDDRRDDSPSSNNRPIDPIFIWNITCLSDPLSNAASFRTKLNIYPAYQYTVQDNLTTMINHGILSYYPFDSYGSVIFAFANETLTNQPVFLALAPVSRTSSSNYDITIVNRLNSSGQQEEYVAQKMIYADVMLKRSTLVIGYCLVITVTFWMVTLMVCLLMITTVVFGYRQRNEIVVVPIGTVFAFTQLRSRYSVFIQARTPPGDILDFAGLLPCLVLLSICAVSMVGIYLFTDPHDPSRKTFTWDELVNVLRLFIRRMWNTTKRWAQCARFRIRTKRRKTSTVVEIPLANLDCEIGLEVM
ncbi:hypothetical protein ARMGADRAFT_1091569 [Armillaria gallica]|uniref:Uncharacterized protein n=1 Tax=Armillaria gallica TaxID=47427 RepID=A0A2H3CH12_ARMGA|nr:hypothetical protein ARMGADRAFT_1091569 [Armillaria gallica]